MIKVENIEVWGFEHAVRGMRNPLDSHAKSDSYYGCQGTPCAVCRECDQKPYSIGANDLDLMRRLYKSGTEHRKYMRQIFVSMDIVAPRCWYLEFDTYKVGTTTNSCSTMHTIHKKPFTVDDFTNENLSITGRDWLEYTVELLNKRRDEYLATKDKDVWREMIDILPQSYNQRRTVTMNYENVVNMIKQRENHKLKEWREFTAILKNLPYIKEIMEA